MDAMLTPLNIGGDDVKHDIEWEIARLKIMEEVGLRFDEIVTDLNEKGTSYSREFRIKAEKEIESIRKEAAEVVYKTKSLDQAVKATSELIKEALGKVDASVKMSRDAAECTLSASKFSESAQIYADDARKYMLTYGLTVALSVFGLVVTLILGSISIAAKADEQIKQQKATVEALQEKIRQDEYNQADLGKMFGRMEAILKKGN